MTNEGVYRSDRLIPVVERRGDVEDRSVEAAGQRCAEVVEFDLLGVDLEDEMSANCPVIGYPQTKLTKLELPRYDLMSSSPIKRMVVSSSVLKMSMSLETPSWP